MSELSDHETSWQKVNSGSSKRLRREMLDNPSKKPYLDKPGNIESNRFAVLSEVNEAEMPVEQKQTEIKPPPIFIPNVENISLMKNEFNKVISDNSYSYKSLRDGQIRVSVKDIKNYRALIKYLELKKSIFHTYQPKQERAFRVVVKNLHHTTPIIDIKTELLEYGHVARNIVNIKSRSTKLPLPMFFVDLEPGENNKNVYEIKYINNAVVRIEPPRRFDDLIQCHRCQEFGHTKTYCKKPFRCVKCGLNHATNDCQKSENSPAQCLHCLKNHTASYKGCQVYQDILKRQKTSSKSNNRTIFTEREQNTYNFTRPTMSNATPQQYNQNSSYADALKNQANTNTSNLESMLMKQMELMNTMISMMTAIMNKLCN